MHLYSNTVLLCIMNYQIIAITAKAQIVCFYTSTKLDCINRSISTICCNPISTPLPSSIIVSLPSPTLKRYTSAHSAPLKYHYPYPPQIYSPLLDPKKPFLFHSTYHRLLHHVGIISINITLYNRYRLHHPLHHCRPLHKAYPPLHLPTKVSSLSPP